MIDSLEDKSKKELTEIVKIQQEHAQQSEKEFNRLIEKLRIAEQRAEKAEAERDELKAKLEKAEGEVGRLKGLFHKWKEEKDNAVWESDLIFKSLLAESKAYLLDEDGLSNKEWFKKHVEYSINKFAIEHQMKGVWRMKNFTEHELGGDFNSVAAKLEGQLRKELEK